MRCKSCAPPRPPTGYKFIEAEWLRYASINIGSDNGLSTVRRQAINWTIFFLLIGPLGSNISHIWFKIQELNFHKRKLIRDVVCKLSAMLPQSQYFTFPQCYRTELLHRAKPSAAPTMGTKLMLVASIALIYAAYYFRPDGFDPGEFQHPWWRHQMETFSALLALSAGNLPVPVNSPHKGQWRRALMFSLICVWKTVQ